MRRILLIVLVAAGVCVAGAGVLLLRPMPLAGTVTLAFGSYRPLPHEAVLVSADSGHIVLRDVLLAFGAGTAGASAVALLLSRPRSVPAAS